MKTEKEISPGVTLHSTKKEDGDQVIYHCVDRKIVGRRAKYRLDLLKHRGDLLRILTYDNLPDEKALRSCISGWCRHYFLKMKVSKIGPGDFRVELTDGEFIEDLRKPVGPKTVRFPELATMDVGDWATYDYIYPPYKGSYMPRGLVGAMLREKRKGKHFEYSAINAAVCRVLRVK